MRGKPSPLARMGQPSAVTALAAAAALTMTQASTAQFSTVLNIPPDSIVDATTIDSDTQVNLTAGGILGSNIDFGKADGTSSNVELNVHGGSVTQANINPGTTVNVSGGLIGTLGFTGDSLNVTGGTIQTIRVGNGDGAITISDGLVNDLNFDDATAFNQTLKISGGEVYSTTGIGYAPPPEGFLQGGNILISGGTVALTGNTRLIIAQNITVTGGNITGSLYANGGTGSVRDVSVNGSVNARIGGVMNMFSGSATGAGAVLDGQVNLYGGMVSGDLYSYGGSINIDGASVNADRFYIDQFVINRLPVTLNLYSGLLKFEHIELNHRLFGRAIASKNRV